MTTTQQSIQQALSLLKERTWVDLTHSFSADTPRFNAFSPLEKKTLFDYSAGFFAQQFTFAGQYGTHIDAPVHFVEGGRYLNDITLKELVLPLVVIDVSTDVAKNPDFTITVREILSFEEQYGEIDSGSFVALRTDWSKRIDDSEAFNNKDADDMTHTPGWSVEALRFLFEERHIRAVGHETFDTDSSEEFYKNKALKAELYVLQQDAYQIELLTNLDQLPAKGAVIFNIVAKPDKATGFPVRSFAILP